MWRDLRNALRGFRLTPGFTAAAVLALAFAIGANAVIFSLIDGLWLRPPGIDRPSELVRLFQTTQTSDQGTWSFPEYEAVRDRASSLAGVAALGRRGSLMAAPDGTSEILLTNVVSPDFFEVLGVQAIVGRLFGAGDALGAPPSVVLGHDFWQRRFGSDESMVGSTVTVGRPPGTPLMVLGVLPPSFRDLSPDADRDLWMPVTTWESLYGADELTARDNRWLEIVARLGSGQSVEAANSEVAAVASALAIEWPATNTARGARVVSDLDYRLRNAGSSMVALGALVLIVVLITCVNLAHLLLARAADRRRELAVRTALGAGRRHLIRQLLVEAVALGGFGAATGLLVGAWLIRVLPWLLVTPPRPACVRDLPD